MKQISLSKGAEINVLFIRKYPMASKAFRDLDKEKNGVISRSQFLKVGDTHAHTFFFWLRSYSLHVFPPSDCTCPCVCVCVCVSVSLCVCDCVYVSAQAIEDMELSVPRYSLYLLYWYKSSNTYAEGAARESLEFLWTLIDSAGEGQVSSFSLIPLSSLSLSPALSTLLYLIFYLVSPSLPPSLSPSVTYSLTHSLSFSLSLSLSHTRNCNPKHFLRWWTALFPPFDYFVVYFACRSHSASLSHFSKASYRRKR